MNIDFKTIVTSEWFNRGLLLSKRTAVFNPKFYEPDYPVYEPNSNIFGDYVEGYRTLYSYTDEENNTIYEGLYGGAGCSMFSGELGQTSGRGRGSINYTGEITEPYVSNNLSKYVIDTPQDIKDYYFALRDEHIFTHPINTSGTNTKPTAYSHLVANSTTAIIRTSNGVTYYSDGSELKQISGNITVVNDKSSYRLQKGYQITFITQSRVNSRIFNGIDTTFIEDTDDAQFFTLNIFDDLLDRYYTVNNNGYSEIKYPLYRFKTKEYSDFITDRLFVYDDSVLATETILDITINRTLDIDTEGINLTKYDDYAIPITTAANRINSQVRSYQGNKVDYLPCVKGTALGLYRIQNINDTTYYPETYSAYFINYVEDDKLICKKYVYESLFSDELQDKINSIQEGVKIPKNIFDDTVHTELLFATIDLNKYKSYIDGTLYAQLYSQEKVVNGFYAYQLVDSYAYYDELEPKLLACMPSNGGGFYFEKFSSSTGVKKEHIYDLPVTKTPSTESPSGKPEISTPKIDISNGIEPGAEKPKPPETMEEVEDFIKNSSSGGKGLESETDISFVLPEDSQLNLPVDPETGEEYIEAEVEIEITDSMGNKHKITKKVYYTAPKGKVSNSKTKVNIGDLLSGYNVSIIDIKVKIIFEDDDVLNALEGVNISNKLTDTVNNAAISDNIVNPPFVKDSMTDSLVISDSYYVQRLKSSTLRVSVTDNFEMTSESNTIKTLSSMDTSTQSNSAVLSDFVSITKTN